MDIVITVWEKGREPLTCVIGIKLYLELIKSSKINSNLKILKKKENNTELMPL
jgi:hypothetical protein